MSKGGRRAYLGGVLESHVRSIQEIFQMLEEPPPSSLDKVAWSQVTKLGDEISKQATVAGMLWSGETPDVKALEENMGAYCNLLHGFILLCHGSTVGAGPTLHASICASAKQVIDCSISLLREAVSSCDSRSSNKSLSIPKLSGLVWEACDALKKTPTTNCTAIGRAMAQVAVSVKDVLRELGELKPAASDDDSADGTSGEAADKPQDSDEEGGLIESDLGDGLTPEEMGIAQLAISVVSDALTIIKEVIRFITGLLKSSGHVRSTEDYVDSLERLLGCCQEMGTQVNELGASVYPPQEISQMKLISKKMHGGVDEMRAEVGSLQGSSGGVYEAFEGLKNSLGKLECMLGDDLVPEMGRLAV
ncbi:uncharacterized protein LOC103715161 [Phoenix dactylifera]|uniref:Uncharacterized protein LOC103715161 n=1 Tax=Phoenix dactylifera TaxID=42345 RepID=A0A8B7CK95_PHODC|nr:uncharacterized protein LOC103715161 [Phoenix dactylifera]